MSSLHPVIVRINTVQLEQSNKDPMDYLSTLVFDMMYHNSISNPADESIIESYRYIGTVPLSVYFPPEGKSTLFESGIDLGSIGEQLINRNSFQEEYEWDDLQLEIELTNNTAKFVLRPAEDS